MRLPELRERGVYVLDRERFAALANNDEGDYAYALADVEIAGSGFRMAHHQDFSLFVDKDGSIFSVYAKADRRYRHRTIHDLVDTGATVPPL